MELSIQSNVGIASPLYWMVWGQNPATGEISWLDPQGNLHPCQIGDDCSTYQFLLGGGATVPVPDLISARVVFSMGQKLRIAIVKDGNGKPNVQDAVFFLPSDPNYDVIYDKVEFSIANAQIWVNTTQVDFFAIPSVVTISNPSTSVSSAPLSSTRGAVFDAFKGIPFFSQLVVPNTRIVSPGYSPTFPTNYLDEYIRKTWGYFATKPLSFALTGAPAGFDFAFGTVKNGVFGFTDNLGNAYPVRKPTSTEVFLCNGAFDIDGTLAAPQQQVDGIIKRQIGAGMNRGVLTSADRCGTPFYTGAATNHYSRIMHESFANGQAYGFPYDDVCNQFSSTLSLVNATKMSIVLEKF